MNTARLLLLVALALAANASSVSLSGAINGQQEVPPVTSTASGSFTGTYDDATRELKLTITHDIASPTAAHVHLGAVGVSGGVVFAIDHTSNPIEVDRTLTTSEAADLVASKYYVNIHTTANPTGEIRGQITYPTAATPSPTGAAAHAAPVVLGAFAAVAAAIALVAA